MVVEVLVAISIITVSILSAMAVAQKSIYVSRQALHATQASFLLEEGAEVTRLLRDNGWSNITGLVSGKNYYPAFIAGTWVLSPDENLVGNFTRTVMIENVSRDNTTNDISTTGINDVGTKLVTVTVSWPEGGAAISKNLQFYLMDIHDDN